jgi:hypothetical protein
MLEIKKYRKNKNFVPKFPLGIEPNIVWADSKKQFSIQCILRWPLGRKYFRRIRQHCKFLLHGS